MGMRVGGDPRGWFILGSAVACAPLLYGVVAWILSLHWILRTGLGVVVGVALAAIFNLSQLHRSHQRTRKALHVAHLCHLDASSLGKLFRGKSFPTWVAEAEDFEHVNWLNRQLEEIWPSLNEAASGLLKGILQSVLDPYKFSVIQKISIKSVTLGIYSPLLGGVKFTEAGSDEAILEVELDWQHGQDSKIEIQLQTTGPLLTVQVKDFTLFGVMKLIFKPLQEQFPGFGAITLSLREPPIVDFNTTFLGGDVLMIPGIDNAVDNIILTALMDLLVWPNRLVIPILDGDYSYLELKPVGHLEVELVEAKDLAKMDLFGHSDAYAMIYIRRKQGCIRTSSVKSNSHSPIWNEKFILDVEDPETQKLTIRMMDQDPFKPDDFIGVVEIPLSDLEPSQMEDVWFDLVDDSSKAENGKVRVRILLVPLASNETENIPSELANDNTENGQEELYSIQ